MASIAEFTLPAEAFPLGRVFADRPELRFELDRVIHHGQWVTAGSDGRIDVWRSDDLVDGTAD